LPLLFLVIIGLLRHAQLRTGKRWPVVVMGLLGAFSVWSFARTSDLYRSGEWWYDVQSREAMATLHAEIEQLPGTDSVHVGNTWFVGPAMTCDREPWPMGRLARLRRLGVDSSDVFRYISLDDLHEGDTAGCERIAGFERSRTVLYRHEPVMVAPSPVE